MKTLLLPLILLQETALSFIAPSAPFRPASELYSSTKTPIHLLAGFLGSGKTTTLQHLLENAEGRKIGVIVNDVASVNIDAKLVVNQGEQQQGIVELQNGCACCSIADEFLGSIELLQQRSTEWDAIVVELSGVADPVAVANLWKQAVREDAPVTHTADLQSTVTLVDSSTFGTDYMTWDLAGDRWKPEDTDGCAGNRKISELLAEQVEAAALVLLNKKDMTDDKQMGVTESLIRNLNPDATVIATSFGKTDSVTQLLDAARNAAPCEEPGCTDHSHSHNHEPAHSHDHAAACEDPTCTDASHSHDHDHACTDADCTDHSHSHNHKNAVDDLGIANFVYRASRPFEANRLSQLLFQWPIPVKDTLLETFEETKTKEEKSPFCGVVRSKGFAWIAPTVWDGIMSDNWRHNAVVYWSHAGKHLDLQQNAGTWWADIPDEDRRQYLGDYERVMREDFVSEEFGDRRQELVFIGLDVQQEAIEKALDECLLTDDEMETYRENLVVFREKQKEMAASSS